MIVVRDVDTSEVKAQKILDNLGMEKEKMSVLDGNEDPLAAGGTDCVFLITSMPSGWLGYHQKFFSRHRRDVPLWIIMLVNDDSVVLEQAKNGFHADGIRLYLLPVTSDTDFGQISKTIQAAMKIKANKVLLYSIRPNCGKKTLMGYLQDKLDGWAFETAEEDFTVNKLAKSDAAHIVIVGKTLKDFAVSIPNDNNPLYVLTMPDENVQAYLHMDELPSRLIKIIPAHLQWTEEAAASHLFYISPLYERWRAEGTTPVFDSRFIMWDNFGLPLPRKEYGRDKVDTFLSQFNQCDRLIKALTE